MVNIALSPDRWRDSYLLTCKYGKSSQVQPRTDGKSERTKGYVTKGDSMHLILLVILILALLGALPRWPYSTGWGYYPSGGLGIVVLILIILLLTGRL
jgi:hypothetical protein